jgi:hypothetical protein
MLIAPPSSETVFDWPGLSSNPAGFGEFLLPKAQLPSLLNPSKPGQIV